MEVFHNRRSDVLLKCGNFCKHNSDGGLKEAISLLPQPT